MEWMIFSFFFRGVCGFFRRFAQDDRGVGIRQAHSGMKLSSNWIRDFVDLTVDDRRLAEDLTNVGIAVEGISGTGADTVFEMEIGTNRPDAMNHYGVAREAAAIYELPLRQLSAISSQLSASAAEAATSASADAALKGRSSTA